MINKQQKNPDLTRFGFYLYPKVYRGSMGFDKAHGLLFLDSKGRIDQSLAKQIGLIHLLNSSSAVLYAINPTGGRYPNASELLSALSLGSVASQRLISKEELHQEFLEQCTLSNISIELLDRADRLGMNKDGHYVYESKSGRYLTDDDGIARRDVPPQNLLYAVDAEGNLVDEQIKYCLESLYKFHLNVHDDKLDYIDAGDFNAFMQTITRCPPTRLPNMGDYEPISFYGESHASPLGAKSAQVIDVLERIEAQLMQDVDFDDIESFENYFHHLYNRDLPATKHGFKPNMPAPLLVILFNLMNFNLIDTPHIHSPNIASLILLAGLTKLHKQGAKISGVERLADKQEEFNRFLSDLKIDDFTIHSEASPTGFDGSISYLPIGDDSSSVLIPQSDTHSYKKSVIQMLDTLGRRNHYGRSIFIGAVDSDGSLGRLDSDSALLISYLYENYYNLLVFDCNQALSLPNRNHCEYRVYIIGEFIEDPSEGHKEDAAQFRLNPKIETVDTAEDFYKLCASYMADIASVEISSVDLMDNLMSIIEYNDKEGSTPAHSQASSTTSDENKPSDQVTTEIQADVDAKAAESAEQVQAQEAESASAQDVKIELEEDSSAKENGDDSESKEDEGIKSDGDTEKESDKEDTGGAGAKQLNVIPSPNDDSGQKSVDENEHVDDTNLDHKLDDDTRNDDAEHSDIVHDESNDDLNTGATVEDEDTPEFEPSFEGKEPGWDDLDDIEDQLEVQSRSVGLH